MNLLGGHNARLEDVVMSRASILINCTRETGSIEQETPAGKELNVMRNRADGTRKITRVATCGTQRAGRKSNACIWCRCRLFAERHTRKDLALPATSSRLPLFTALPLVNQSLIGTMGELYIFSRWPNRGRTSRGDGAATAPSYFVSLGHVCYTVSAIISDRITYILACR